MTVERVISRNRLDRTNHNLMDDLRRLAEDCATLALDRRDARIASLRAALGRAIALDHGPFVRGDFTRPCLCAAHEDARAALGSAFGTNDDPRQGGSDDAG